MRFAAVSGGILRTGPRNLAKFSAEYCGSSLNSFTARFTLLLHNVFIHQSRRPLALGYPIDDKPVIPFHHSTCYLFLNILLLYLSISQLMLSLHLFDFTKVVALNSPNSADEPLRTYSTNQQPVHGHDGCRLWINRANRYNNGKNDKMLLSSKTNCKMQK